MLRVAERKYGLYRWVIRDSGYLMPYGVKKTVGCYVTTFGAFGICLF